MSKRYPIEEGTPLEIIRQYWGFYRRDDLSRIELRGLKKRKKIIPYPDRNQLNEFGTSPLEDGARNREAPVFEAIAQAEYGGLRKKQRELCPGENGDSLTSTPDLLDLDRHFAKEIKGIQQGNSLNLFDVQIAKYLILMAGGYFKEDLSFDFEIFRHGVANLTDLFKEKGLEGLIECLTGNVRYQLSLPFTLVYHLHSSKCPYTGRHEKKGEGRWGSQTYTRFQSTGLDAMIADPEETITQIGLDPNNYSVEMLRFPRNMKMLGEKVLHPISPFPTVVIRDVNPRALYAMLSQIDFDKYLRAIHTQTDINLKNLKLPDYVQIPQDILEEIEYREEHEKFAREKLARERGFLERDLLSGLEIPDDQGDITFDVEELEKTPPTSSEIPDDI